MRKKTIIISVIAVVVVAGIATAVLLLVRGVNNKSMDSDDDRYATTKTIPDPTKDYGACDLLTTTAIKSALGTSADKLATGFNAGKGLVGNGDTEQSCVYGLSKQVTEISALMLTDSFYTTVYVYKDQASKTADTTSYDNSIPVDGIGDKAGFFTSVDQTLKTTEYSLRVDVGLRYYAFAIRQTTSTKTFDETSALAALTTLAKSIDYSKFANKN